MHLKEIGEFGLVKRFQKQIKTDRSVFKGSGDDCAVLKLDNSNYQLFTCDMIIEGVDFRKTDNLENVGRKALAISISDIAACGGLPKHAVVSLGLPKNMQVHQVDLLAKGLFDLAKEYKINIVGGDISASTKLIIDVSMLGKVEKYKLCLRRGAKYGDIIMVTGDFGGSIKGKHLKFTPRLKEARFLVDNFKINSMIDVSDGLVQDLGHILEQSSVGAVLYESLLPLSREAKGIEEALCSGEEFELLFTVSRDQASKIIKCSKYRFRVIGEIMPASFGLRLINQKNRYSRFKLRGYCAEARTARFAQSGRTWQSFMPRCSKGGYKHF
ncbi:MAG: thiamine-phosphate kinase [Candidatus Omnitrophica bacterium]|nr:thiamine-phosphate kinase [Candidatus Omnitrophota bacterium]MBU1922659.1 thiamine-phosphate kinase [Candidatus Omnitrophota bacterium]